MTPAIISAVSNLQDFYDNPFIYTPFRLPTLNEKATDSELSDLLSSTITEANPPIKTLRNIIGNFFKPSAVCAALGGTDNIKNYVYGDLKPSEWAPLAPPAVDLLFSELKRKVTTDTIEQPDLRPFMAERWYPKKSPNLERDDFWHTALHTPSSPVFTAPTPPPPWRLNDVLAAHLFNHGIRLITLHDKIEHQRARAETRDLPFVPSSKFGRYRHDYEWLIPSLKFFSPSTLLTRSFQPFAYDELENYESAVSSQYSTDLQDILSALLSLWGSPPLPSFAADPEGLGYLLVHGIHRWPEDLARFIHIEPAPHDTPTTFYTRVFLHPLRFPALRALGLPDPDVNAIEQATRSALLAMPLLQALDYLHTQLLSGLCVAAPPRGLIPRDKMLDPMRRQPHPVACRLTRPREALQQVLSPTFRCWLGKRISPSMTLVTLKCDSVPWANYFTQGQKGPLHAGFQTENLLQLTFPTQKPYTLKDHSAFAFALYLTSVTHPGRTTEEPNSAFSDRSAAHVTQLSGILLPILLRYHMFTSKADTQGLPVGHLKLHHMLDTDDPTLVDIPELPPLMLDQSFFMPVSAIRSFFQTVTRVPFYRFPKTLGWPTMDVTLEPATSPASPSFSNLHSFFAILPNFFPPSVRALLSSYKTDDAHGPSHFYTSEAYAHLQQLNIRPGTSSSSMDIEYTWPVNWDIPDFTSILEPLYFMHSLHSTHPNLLPLLRSLGPHFLRSLTSALLASNQHFPSLLLATLYGLRSGHTTLCVQGIFGAGKTFSASLLLIVLSTILDVNTLLSAEPNLPLATAIENIDLLLQHASDDVRAQYGRILANHVKVSSKLDMTPLDRQASFKADSPKRCILVTQGSLLRDLCRDHPQLQSFIQSCRVAINDEAQQGGQAGFTVLAGFLSIHCLQILTGDKEQNRSGTGGEPTKEALLERLALKSVGFLNNTTALFPWEFAKDVGRALRQFQPFTSSLPTVPDVHCLLASLSSCALPPALSPSTVHQAEGMTPTRGVTLSLIADPYFTQVATHYPHLHRLEDNNVEYGHYEDQPAEVQESRLYHDMRNHPHHCSGYRVIHWNPNLAQNSIHLQPSSINTIIRILAVISYFTARAVRLDEESSKLLILAPHNDTIDDLEGKLGAPAPNYPPTLFDFYLVCIYRRYYLPTNCDKFQYTNSQGNTVTPVPQGVSTADIHRYITGNEALKEDLQSRASISLIVELATSYPRGFATYCTVSNTVRAIGIGGTASLFLSAKMSTFLAASPAADARNLVALTRSKGLSVLLLPTTQKFIDCSLHSILTQCAWRHGIFHVGTADLDTQALADYISQPDTTLNDQPSVFTSSPGFTPTKSHLLAAGTHFPSVCASPRVRLSRISVFLSTNTFPRRIRQRSRPPPLNGKG